jgi:hypothetical protein
LARMLAKVSDWKGEHRMRCVTVVIADQHPIVLEGLKNVLGAQHDFKVVACCSDGAGCIEAIRNFLPNIAIIDVSMPDLIGPEIFAIAKHRESFHAASVFRLVCCRPRIDYSRRGGCLLCHSKGCGVRNSRWGPAENRRLPEAATPSFLRLGRISRAEEWDHRRDREDQPVRTRAPIGAIALLKLVISNSSPSY